MATGTHAGSTWDTNATDHTVTATPAVGDLIVVVHGQSGWVTTEVTTITDDNADGLGTYTRLGDATTPLADGGISSRAMWISVRNALIGSETSTIFTETQTGNKSGGGLTVLRFSGMTKVGAAAIRQSIGENSQTEDPPTITFASTTLTTNPIVLAVMGNDGSPNITSPTGFTEAFDGGWATPTAGVQVCWDDDGNAATLFEWSSGGFGAEHGEAGIELDASSGGRTTKNTRSHPLGIRSGHPWRVVA